MDTSYGCMKTGPCQVRGQLPSGQFNKTDRYPVVDKKLGEAVNEMTKTEHNKPVQRSGWFSGGARCLRCGRSLVRIQL